MDDGFPQNRETKEALNDEKTDLRACGGAAAPWRGGVGGPGPSGGHDVSGRVPGGGGNHRGVTFAVTQAAYDGASLTLKVLLTPNDEDTALMDNQVELPPEDSWFLREKETAAALGDRVLGVACDLCGLTDQKGNNLALEYRCTPARRGRTMTYTFEVPLKNAPETAQVELYFGVNEDLGFRFEQDARLLLRVPLLALVPLTAN